MLAVLSSSGVTVWCPETPVSPAILSASLIRSRLLLSRHNFKLSVWLFVEPEFPFLGLYIRRLLSLHQSFFIYFVVDISTDDSVSLRHISPVRVHPAASHLTFSDNTFSPSCSASFIPLLSANTRRHAPFRARGKVLTRPSAVTPLCQFIFKVLGQFPDVLVLYKRVAETQKHENSLCKCWFWTGVVCFCESALRSRTHWSGLLDPPLAGLHDVVLVFSGCAPPLTAAWIFCTTYLQAGREEHYHPSWSWTSVASDINCK